MLPIPCWEDLLLVGKTKQGAMLFLGKTSPPPSPEPTKDAWVLPPQCLSKWFISSQGSSWFQVGGTQSHSSPSSRWAFLSPWIASQLHQAMGRDLPGPRNALSGGHCYAPKTISSIHYSQDMAHIYCAEEKEIKQVQSLTGPPLWYNFLIHKHIWALNLMMVGGVLSAKAPAASGHNPWWIPCRSVLHPPMLFSFLPCLESSAVFPSIQYWHLCKMWPPMSSYSPDGTFGSFCLFLETAAWELFIDNGEQLDIIHNPGLPMWLIFHDVYKSFTFIEMWVIKN